MATWAFAIARLSDFRVIYSQFGFPEMTFLALNGGCGRPTFRDVIKGRDELPNLYGTLESCPNWWNPSHGIQVGDDWSGEGALATFHGLLSTRGAKRG